MVASLYLPFGWGEAVRNAYELGLLTAVKVPCRFHGFAQWQPPDLEYGNRASVGGGLGVVRALPPRKLTRIPVPYTRQPIAVGAAAAYWVC